MALIALAALAALALLPADAAAKKRKKHLPQIDVAMATYEESEGGVTFALRVERADSVVVTYHGQRSEAFRQNAMPDWWQTPVFAGAPAVNCYRIQVTARNQRRAITREVEAGRLGTRGCERG